MTGLLFNFVLAVISPAINGLTNSTVWSMVWFDKKISFLSPHIVIFCSILFLMITVFSTWRKFTISLTVFWVVLCVISVTFTIISFVCVKNWSRFSTIVSKLWELVELSNMTFSFSFMLLYVRDATEVHINCCFSLGKLAFF